MFIGGVNIFFLINFDSLFGLIFIFCKIKERYNNFGIRVTFENDGLIESEDSSIESCVTHVLHHSRHKDFINKYIRSSTHFLSILL
jgi:hypothetical protein